MIPSLFTGFVPVVVAVVIGVMAGWIRRGRLASVVRPRLGALAVVAVGCSVAADAFDLPAPALWAMIGMVAGVVFAASNLMIGGMSIIGLGIIANLVPLVVNGATPVRADALVSAEIVARGDLDRAVLAGPRAMADPQTSFEILGDVIPVPGLGQVVSFGDLIVLIGLTAVIHNLMRRRTAGSLPRGVEHSLTALGWTPPVEVEPQVEVEPPVEVEPAAAA